MSFISGVWRLLGADVDESENENIVEYPSSHPAMQSRAEAVQARPIEQIIAMPEPLSMVICVVRPGLDNGGKEQYSMKRYCDMLRKNQAMIVDLNDLSTVDEEHAVRVIDILNGIILANEGRVYKIAKNIYIFTPKNVKMAGDPIEQVEIA
jgi:FtsZ-interacting cell division protein YlmF